jgi:hypothetical protein
MHFAGFLPSAIAVAAVLAGCAGSPPAPPQPEGDYRPVNRVEAPPAASGLFDLYYDGDISGALPAIARLVPQLQVMPSVGRAAPLPVRLNLRSANLEGALRSLGDQGAGVAEVVWTTRRPGTNQAFIRFRSRQAKN